MYKGSHLHLHFSGTVRILDLLDELFSSKWIGSLYWNNRKKHLTFVIDGKISNVSSHTRKEIETIINTFKPESQYEEFSIVSSMFYFIIKDERFYPTYIQLLYKSMIRENIDHMELRLKLGGLFRVSNGKTYKLSIRDEMILLYNILSPMDKSIRIIPQRSKYSDKDQIYTYFKEIVDTIIEYPSMRDIFVAFDISGDEEKGKSFNVLKETIDSIISLMKISFNSIESIPFFLHAGEIPIGSNHTLSRSLSNIRFAIDHGGYIDHSGKYINRIGHGIYSLYDEELMMDIYEKNIILEFCPLSMLHFKNATPTSMKDIIIRLNESPILFTINADDPNKIKDKDLDDNISYLLSHGFDEKQIYISFLCSILGSQCSVSQRDIMIEKWYDKYYQLFSNVLQYLLSATLSLFPKTMEFSTDLDNQWRFKMTQNGYDILSILIPVINMVTKIAIDEIVSSGHHMLIELIKGTYMYKSKSVTSNGGTWPQWKYRHYGFQCVYLRLKSIQRFTEMYSILEHSYNKGIIHPLVDRYSKNGSISVFSIGGGPGFELYAFRVFMEKYFPSIQMKLISVDIETIWQPYVEHMNMTFLEGSFKDTYIIRDSILIYSYVVAQFLHTDYTYFRDMLDDNNSIFINEGVKKISAFSKFPKIQMIPNDDRQLFLCNSIVQKKDITPIPLSFPDTPYT